LRRKIDNGEGSRDGGGEVETGSEDKREEALGGGFVDDIDNCVEDEDRGNKESDSLCRRTQYLPS